jgi:hypothetical protein
MIGIIVSRVVILIATGALRLALCLPIIACANTTKVHTLNYKEALQCGPNSLFMFLILTGHPDVTLEQLKGIEILSNGTSLLALRDTARSFGVDGEIRRYNPSSVDAFPPVPAIVQFKTGESSLTWHFNVLYKIDDHGMYVLNGTTGAEDMIPRTRLSVFWSGYALVEKETFAKCAKRWCGSVRSAFCVFVVECFVLGWAWRNSKGSWRGASGTGGRLMT